MAELLRCPRCGSELRDGDGKLVCTSACGNAYPVVRGVPILLDERQSVFRAAAYNDAAPARSTLSGIKQRVFRWLPSLDMNLSGAANMQLLSDLLTTSGGEPLLLNIGGKHPASATASLCSKFDCIECDLAMRPRTNLIADPQRLPLADQSVDAVLIDAMLEHVLDPFECVAEIHRVLKPGGLVYSDTPFMLQVHGGAMDVHRFSMIGHRRLFRRFEEIASGMTAGPGVALGYAIQFFWLSFFSSQWSRAAVEAACRLSLFWIKYADLLLRRLPGAVDAAHGFYFLGRRSDEVLADEELLAGYRGSTKAFLPIPVGRSIYR